MKIEFMAFCRTVSILGMLGGLSSTLRAQMPKDFSPDNPKAYEEAVAYNKISPDERMRYDQGEALDKAIALYGLATLRHYSATVVSIKPAPAGGGLEIELTTKMALRHKAGEPWYVFDSQPIASRRLHWHWPDARPAPAYVGFEVEAFADERNRVQRISECLGLIAMRRIKPNGPWEILVVRDDASGLSRRELAELAAHGGAKTHYMVLQPDHLNLLGFELEWTAEYGLALSLFRSEYGGDDEDENENHGSDWSGWSLANVAGQHVRPGRDGWQTLKTVLANDYPEKVSLRLLPPGQYIGRSNWLSSGLPWSP
jgi:hypothetical protein